MDSQRSVPPVSTTSSTPVPNKFEKPLWLYTERVVRVAGYALGVLAAAFAARALYLVYSGVSVLTPATAVSAVLIVIACVAFRFLRVHADGVAAARKAALDYIEQNPKACLGIKDYLTRHPGLTYPEVAARVANYEASTQPFTKFCDRNGIRAIAYITDEDLLKSLFKDFLVSFEERYIKPGFSQQEYEAALPHFMGSDLRGEFQLRWIEHLRRVSENAKERFLRALTYTETYLFDYGGALAAARDPGERLGVSRNEILNCVARREFDVYTLGAFVKRNGQEAFQHFYRVDPSIFFDKLGEFVDIEREKNSGIPAEYFDSYINAICTARPDLRAGLEECVRKKFAQPPPTSLAAAPPAATVPSLADDADPAQRAKRAFLARLTDANFSISRSGYLKVTKRLGFPQEFTIDLDDIAPIVANRELMQHSYEKFLDRNGLCFIHHVSNRPLLREKFLTFVEDTCRSQPGRTHTVARFRMQIDHICPMSKDPLLQECIDRQALEQEVARICAGPATAASAAAAAAAASAASPSPSTASAPAGP